MLILHVYVKYLLGNNKNNNLLNIVKHLQKQIHVFKENKDLHCFSGFDPVDGAPLAMPTPTPTKNEHKIIIKKKGDRKYRKEQLQPPKAHPAMGPLALTLDQHEKAE